MNVSLPKKQEQYVKSLVENGRYKSASEVVQTGLRMLEEQEDINKQKLEELKRLIQEGVDSGPTEPLDMEEIKAAARRQFERRQGRAA